jgi:Protein of unknown function (DUF2782)
MKAITVILLVFSASASAQVKDAPEPKVERTVIQDEGARIEELRVRGQVQRVVVKPKNAAEYEIVAPPGGRDPSQNRANQQPGAGGQRVWNVLKF